MLRIESLDHEGRGIARSMDGKVIFVEGALPGETVTFNYIKKKPNFDLASAQQIVQSSFMRTMPPCPVFGVCGGCSMQHVDAAAQVAIKQRVLEDSFKHIGKVTPDIILPAIHGAAWEYRYRARFSVRYVEKKGGILVGFHEKRSTFIVDMRQCEVIPRRISELLGPLRELLNQFSIRRRVPQIELALGDDIDVLVLRVLDEPSEEDKNLLIGFARQYSIQWFLQRSGPDSAMPFPDAPRELFYRLPEFDLRMPFSPTEFTQVNPAINRVLVRRAMRLLQPLPNERVADLFCGLGNFTQPIAKLGAHAVGVEANDGLLKRALQNAEANGVAQRVQFINRDLFKINAQGLAELGHFDKWLIDPPREGAVELIKAIEAHTAPQRIVYVSCSPSTLARDAAVLVHAKGYTLQAAGVINMFPHTAHVESIAVFERK